MKTEDLVVELIKKLVDHPDEVSIIATVGTSTTVLEVRTNPKDVGQVIGKRGVTANHIRDLLGSIGGHEKRKYVFEIYEGERGDPPQREERYEPQDSRYDSPRGPRRDERRGGRDDDHGNRGTRGMPSVYRR